MKVRSIFHLAAVPLLLLSLTTGTAMAGVNYQCPANILTQGGFIDVKNPANSSDTNCKDPTSALFANCKPQIDPVTGQPSGATTLPGVR